MQEAMRMVKEFHERHGFAVDRTQEQPRADWQTHMHMAAAAAIGAAKSWITSGDLSAERASLILEEAGECVMALKDGDPVELADGLADLIYVVVGTAVAYGIPLEAVLAEVHRSNMTKVVSGEPLLKGKASKGEGFSPADVKSVLERHKREKEEVRG